MRLSVLDLNNVKTALSHRSAILNNILADESPVFNSETPNLYGEDVKMVRKRTLKHVLLTPAEKDEVVVKYESGMTMTAIANEYGCHYTTVGGILRRKGIAIRERITPIIITTPLCSS